MTIIDCKTAVREINWSELLDCLYDSISDRIENAKDAVQFLEIYCNEHERRHRRPLVVGSFIITNNKAMRWRYDSKIVG